MRYLITGGAGFIGGHLAESLIKDGHSVTVIDNLSTGLEKNIAGIAASKNFDFVKGDILVLPELEYLISKSDFVFHMAAAVGVELVVKDPVLTIETNVHGTERVLQGAARKKTKILIASTSEVYGKSHLDSFSETDDLLIGPPTHSRWAYASSKLLDEFLGIAYYRSMDMPAIIVRLFNTVGPRQTGQYGMVVPRFVSNALKNQDIEVYGSGKQTRCFCHVADTVRGLRSLAECPAAFGNVFNIGNTGEISMNQLAEKIKTQLKSGSKIVHIPYEKAYTKGFEDMMRRVPNIEKIKSCTGWVPRLDLEKIIADVAASLSIKKP
jgi:UDP-glucose 4-epimerase